MNIEKQPSLKPVDVVVALQLTVSPESTFSDLARAVGISHGEAHNSLRRLRTSRLTRPGKRAIAVEKLLSFITCGVPVVYPAVYGPESPGVPTAHSAHPFAPHVAADDEPLVWANAEGVVRGTSLTPLFPNAPALSRTNQQLYELITLVDSIRIGRSRETAIAIDLLAKRINAATSGS